MDSIMKVRRKSNNPENNAEKMLRSHEQSDTMSHQNPTGIVKQNA
jgi:hypothetical protein